jgi:hypothetical protein
MYMRVVRYRLAQERHQAILSAARLVPEGTQLAALREATGQKWRYVRQTAGDRPSYTELTDDEFARGIEQLDSYRKGAQDPYNDLAEELTTTDPAEAMTIGGDPEDPAAAGGLHAVVPERVVQKIAGDFQRSTTAAARSLRAVTNTWRALVLNLRLGWLVNNIVGNTGLYMLSNPGPGAFRELVSPTVSRAAMEEFFSEQVAGTLYGTQTPTRGAISRFMGRGPTRRAVRAVPDIARRADIASEQRLRQAVVGRTLRASPELRSLTRDMRGQILRDEQMTTQFLHDNPQLVDRAAQEAYRTLGNYNSLTPFEQNVVRGAIPFYAWYRAITKITFSLPVDSPYRSALVASLGNLGFPREAVYGDPRILGGIPIGDWVLRTTGLNPLMTVPQTAAAAATMGRAALGNLGELGIPVGVKAPSARETAFAAGIVNPVIGWPLTGGLAHTFRYLPESRVLFPPPSKTYADRSRWLELAGWAGAPIRRPLTDAERAKRKQGASAGGFTVYNG